jgi:hypothetical protein
MVTGAVLSMLLGWSLWRNGEDSAGHSKLTDLNRDCRAER